MPHDSVIAGFWIVSMNLWECCPCGLHSVISRLLAGGSLGFRIVQLLLPGSQIAVWLLCGLLFRSCFPLPYQSLRWYNVVISSCTFQLSMNWSADHRPCWFLVCFLGVCWCCCLFLVFVCLPFCFARWQLNGLCIDPTQFSFVCTLSSWLMLPLH